MKNHLPVIGLMGLMITQWSQSHAAEINTKDVIAIHESFIDAIKDRDFTVYEKYLHKDTKIFVDLDPAPGNELQRIELDEFKELALMSLQLADEIDVVEDLIKVDHNKQNNEVAIYSRSTVNMTMMGTHITEIAEGITVYGVREGSIKILSISDQVIESSIKKATND